MQMSADVTVLKVANYFNKILHDHNIVTTIIIIPTSY